MIQLASASGNAAALVFFVFDLLHIDGDDFGARRKARLAELLSHAGSPLTVQRSPGRAWPVVP
jgi:ATP-dependent DNA ligase